MDALNAIEMSSSVGMAPSRAAAPSSGATQAPAGLAGLDFAQKLRSANMSEEEKIRVAAQQFESMLVKVMLKEMRDTIPEGGLFGKSSAEKTFEDLLDDETASSMTSGMGLGLADSLVRQLSATKMGVK